MLVTGGDGAKLCFFPAGCAPIEGSNKKVVIHPLFDPLHGTTQATCPILFVWLGIVLKIMDQIDVEKFRMRRPTDTNAKAPRVLPRHKKGEKFLCGPIPWGWWSAAAQLPGKSLHVASVIWLFALMKKSVTVQLPSSVLKELGVSRKATYRVLKALEGAGLVTCDRGPGRRPIITVLDPPEELNGNGKESGMKGGT